MTVSINVWVFSSDLLLNNHSLSINIAGGRVWQGGNREPPERIARRLAAFENLMVATRVDLE
jgi:hypothetical protein